MKAILEFNESPKTYSECEILGSCVWNYQLCKLRDIEYSYDELLNALEISCYYLSKMGETLKDNCMEFYMCDDNFKIYHGESMNRSAWKRYILNLNEVKDV